MTGLLAPYRTRLDFAYRDRAYFAGIKAKLLTGFLIFLVAAIMVNIAKLLWLQGPATELRIAGNVGMMLVCLAALLLTVKGAVEVAGNGLPLAMVLLAHGMIFFSPAHAEPLGFAIQVFAFDLFVLVVAMVFASRRIAVAVLVVILLGHLQFYRAAFGHAPMAGSLEFAAQTLLRDGLLLFCTFFVLGLTMAYLIEKTRQRSEESLRQTRALNENLEQLVAERTRALTVLNEEKSLLMNMAAHDLRNPALKIRIITELLEGEGDYSRARVRSDLTTIGDTASRMLELLTDLLDVNAIEEGRQKLSPVALDAHELLREVYADFQARANTKGIDLVLLSSPRAPALAVMVDPIAVRQVLDNLVSNALKFSPLGRRVWLGVEFASDRRLHFVVRDEGPGLTAEDRGRIFGKFSRLSAQPTGGETSNGLGLSIVKCLVDRMDGTVEVDSSPGSGATFRVGFPFVDAPPAPVPPKELADTRYAMTR